MKTMGFRMTVLFCAVLMAAACTSRAPDSADAPQAAAAGDGGTLNGEQHEAWSLSTSVDDEGRLVTEVSAKPGYHINEAYPWKLTIGPLQQGKDQAVDFTKKDARFVTSLQADPGQAIDGQLRFSVCNDQHCLTPQADLHWDNN